MRLSLPVQHTVRVRLYKSQPMPPPLHPFLWYTMHCWICRMEYCTFLKTNVGTNTRRLPLPPNARVHVRVDIAQSVALHQRDMIYISLQENLPERWCYVNDNLKQLHGYLTFISALLFHNYHAIDWIHRSDSKLVAVSTHCNRINIYLLERWCYVNE